MSLDNIEKYKSQLKALKKGEMDEQLVCPLHRGDVEDEEAVGYQPNCLACQETAANTFEHRDAQR